ncbi:MAG: hypothetical protein L6Q76_37820, partial [Polyangiaceae bacterium]|nr:hypothetical protein [Polyangiaceae bacterium]
PTPPPPPEPVPPPDPPARQLTIAGEPDPASGAIAADPDPRAANQLPAGPCGAQVPPPPSRVGGSLVVESPPRPPPPDFGSRMRSHIDGSLTAASPRVWTGLDVPSFVQITAGTLELFLLDKVRIAAPESADEDGFLAFYRDPYGASSCDLSSPKNCAFGAALYHCSGKLQWVVGLNDFMSRPDRLEVQDIRFDGGTLYFNEACQSYSKEANGRCSSLVAVDPSAKKVLWRSQPLLSNNTFVVAGEKYLITGYGFTAEPDYLFVLKRSDGSIAQRISVTTGPQRIERMGTNHVRVDLHDGTRQTYRLDGFDGEKPRLVKITQEKVGHESKPPRLGF